MELTMERSEASTGHETAPVLEAQQEHHLAPGHSIHVVAPSPEIGRALAAQQLGVSPTQLSVRVVTSRGKGWFGIGKGEMELEVTFQPAEDGAAAGTNGEAAAAPAAPQPPVPAAPRFQLEMSMGRIAIKAQSATSEVTAEVLATVDAQLTDFPLDVRDESVMVAALRSGDGKPRVFAAISPTILPDPDAGLAVKVRQDGCVAWLIPWAPNEVKREALDAALAGAGVEAGIDQAVLAQTLGKRLTWPVVIARGSDPVPGTDAETEILVEVGTERGGPQIREDGSVDYREIGHRPSATAGQALVRKIPAVPPVDGFDVHGRVVAAPQPKDVNLRVFAGPGTKISDDGNEVSAKVSGLLHRNGQHFEVRPVQAVPGDVNFATGNIDFEGDLNISGGIKSGFVVRATGAIRINGVVEGATVEAGGELQVLGGVVGQNAAVLRAKGGVTVGYVRDAEIHAGGPVIVKREIRNSVVISDHSVTVDGPGLVTGGQVRGRDFVRAKTLGVPASATRTWVQAGWGENFDAGELIQRAVPRVMVTGTVHPGVVMTVANATLAFREQHPNGVWRDQDGRLQWSAS